MHVKHITNCNIASYINTQKLPTSIKFLPSLLRPALIYWALVNLATPLFVHNNVHGSEIPHSYM